MTSRHINNVDYMFRQAIEGKKKINRDELYFVNNVERKFRHYEKIHGIKFIPIDICNWRIVRLKL